MVPLTDGFVAVVLELAPDGIAIIDETGRIAYANANFEQLFGYRRDQLAGQTVELLLPEPQRMVHREHRHDFDQHPVTRPMGSGLDLRGRHADGTTFAVEVGLSPVSTADGVTTIMAVHPIAARRASADKAATDQAVAAGRNSVVTGLDDEVIQRIFSAGLRLNGLLEAATLRQLAVLLPALDDLDAAIRSLRTTHFAQHADGRTEVIQLD